MKYRAVLLVLAVAAAPALSSASIYGGGGFRIGWTTSSPFTGFFGDRGQLRGVEIGADFSLGLPLPVKSLGPVQFFLSPSYMSSKNGFFEEFSGSLFRLIAVAQLSLGTSGAYFRLGSGYAYAKSERLPSFSTGSAWENQVGVGIPLGTLPPAAHISAEVTYHGSSKRQITGWTFGLAVHF